MIEQLIKTPYHCHDENCSLRDRGDHLGEETRRGCSRPVRAWEGSQLGYFVTWGGIE